MDILPGLVCLNAEVFAYNGVNHAVVNGSRHLLKDSPAHILQAIDNSMDAEDKNCLDEMGIEGTDARRDQWATCNLSSYNHTPDYTHGRTTMAREYVQCPKREYCRFQKRLCRTQSQLTGFTPRELEYLKDTAQGLLNKEIAHKWGVSVETVRSHSQNIRIKTGLARKADLVRYAQKLNLLSQNDQNSTPRRDAPGAIINRKGHPESADSDQITYAVSTTTADQPKILGRSHGT